MRTLPPGAKKTILTVQSDTDVTEILRVLLEVERYNVMCARSGKEAFNRIAMQKPDLIFLAIRFSEVDGLDILSRLKGSPDTSSIPVVMLTACRDENIKLDAFSRGAEGYITKPFTKAEITSEIHRLLGDPTKSQSKKRQRLGS